MGCERVASFVPRMRRRPGRSCSCVMGLRDGEVQGSGPSVGMRRERRGEGGEVSQPDECDLCPHEFADDGSDVSGTCCCCGARCCAECLPEGNGTTCASCGLDDGDGPEDDEPADAGKEKRDG